MIKVTVLASSSKGNCTLLSTGQTHVLIDAGISALRIRRHLEDLGLHPKNLSGIFVTHEHRDHCMGLGQLCKRNPLRVFCTRHTAADLGDMAPDAAMTFLAANESLQVGDLRVTTFQLSHDALDPVGFVFECSEGMRMAFVTDTGKVPVACKKHLQHLHGLYLESNYDVQMLQDSGRPYSLISRIASHWGHLSNQQAAELIEELETANLRHLILAHLSQDCNTPQAARDCMQKKLDDLHLSQCELHCAHPVHPLPSIVLEDFQLDNF